MKPRFRLVGWNSYAYLFKDLLSQVTQIVPRHQWATWSLGKWYE